MILLLVENIQYLRWTELVVDLFLDQSYTDELQLIYRKKIIVILDHIHLVAQPISFP